MKRFMRRLWTALALAGLIGLLAAGCGGGGGGGTSGGTPTPPGPTEEKAQAMAAKDTQVAEVVDAAFFAADSQSDLQALEQQVEAIPGVSDAMTDGDMFVVQYDDGGTHVWMSSPTPDESSAGRQGFRVPDAAELPQMRTLFRTPNSTRAAVVNALRADPGFDGADRALEQAAASLRTAGYEVDEINDAAAGIDFFKNDLDSYGVIIILGHGGAGSFLGNYVKMQTGQEYAGAVDYYTYFWDYTLGRMSKVTIAWGSGDERDTQTRTFWGIDDDFINHYYGDDDSTLPDSIVYNCGCQGLKNDAMAKAFVDSGAAVYLGWTETQGRSPYTAQVLFADMEDGDDVGAAFNNLSSHYRNDNTWATASLSFYPQSGSDMQTRECESHHAAVCSQGHVYWQNSCGALEDVHTYCTAGQTCTNGACVDQGGTVTGTVRDNNGSAISGARITTSSSERTYTAATDSAGRYTLTGIPEGRRIITASKSGFSSSFETSVVAGTSVNVNFTLPIYSGTTPTAKPAISLDTWPTTSDTGFVTLTGTISKLDSNQAVMLVNDEEFLMDVDSSGRFSFTAVLALGQNSIRVRATNAVGTTLSSARTVTYTGGSSMGMRVTLTWNADTDMDLHIWDDNGNHTFTDLLSYGNRTAIAGSELDVDNIEGYGPENFTFKSPSQGRYYVGVNYFSDHGDEPRSTKATVNITLNQGTMYEVKKSYELVLSTENFNDEYPVAGTTNSWWRVADIVVDANGIATLQSASSVALNERSASAARVAGRPNSPLKMRQ